MAEKPEPHFGEASDQESTYGEDTPVRVSKNDAVATEDTSNTGDSTPPGQAQKAAGEAGGDDPAKTPDSYRRRAGSTKRDLSWCEAIRPHDAGHRARAAT
jgi:hypothetical protein